MALTSRAPFNKNQFRSFLLENVEGAPAPQASGVGLSTEAHDTASGSATGGIVQVISSLSQTSIGPKSPFSKFRPGLQGFGIAGAGATTEQSDTGSGSGIAAAGPVTSALNRLAVGPKSPFSKFRSQLASSFSPAIVGQATGAAAETPDTAVGAGVAPPPVVSSLNPANLGPSFSAPFNNNQFRAFPLVPQPLGFAVAVEQPDTSSASGAMALAGSGAVAEPPDVAVGSAANTQVGVGAANEGADVPVASGFSTGAASGSPNEDPDVANAAGSQTATGSGAALEQLDVSAAQGVIAGAGAPNEGPDTASAAGTQAVTGLASVTQPSDVSAATGAQSTSGSGAAQESSDVATVVGATSDVGSGSAAEAHDTATASGSVAQVGAGATQEQPDISLASGALQATGSGAAGEQPDLATASGVGTISGSGAAVESPDTAKGQSIILKAIGRIVSTDAYPSRIIPTDIE